MEQLDVRFIAFPCVLAAGVMQYMRFAKKPMSAPFHMISERLARRCVLIGLAIEILTLRLLPLCEAYPMNASCLVFLYFKKESKRYNSMQFREILSCASALSAWLLPFVDPTDGSFPDVLQLGLLLDIAMAPATCAYVGVLLLAGALAHCGFGAGTSVWSCTGPALSFGTSALLLKAAVHIVASLVFQPKRPEAWASLLGTLALLLGVRWAAAAPLRRAIEAHGSLSVLTIYGAVSSAAACTTGGYIYGEVGKWGLERQTLYVCLAFAHCWGMVSLGTCAADDRGHSHAGKSGYSPVPASDSDRRGAERRGVATSESNKGMTGSSRDTSPLLNFNEPAVQRTVDDDAEIEDQLLAHALAPANLSAVGAAGSSAGWADWSTSSARGPAAEPQFDADFEEIMRRFDEDDRLQSGAKDAPALPTDLVAGQASRSSPPPAIAPAGVLTGLDAQTMLEVSYGGMEDEEDELLSSIQDLDGS